MAQLTPVQEYYKDKTVFITGASGFMGKVLLEKLLYSCSDLKQVIIMMRPKRGKIPEVRLEEMWKIPIFQRIKEEKPEVLKKVTLVQGDVTYDGLGLSGDSLKQVVDNTNIVFHMAATLKLEGNLKDAIDMNTTGTKRVLDIGKLMPNLEAFVHLSTAFCNCDQEVMYEKVYDFAHKPEDLMRLAEWMDVKTLDNITPELLTPHPNTYTYSKRLAEILVRDEYPNMPVIIARPSIVSPAVIEPLHGWVDNLNGPTGLMIGAGKGVIRSILIDKTNMSEVIPVDYAINGLIVIPYEFCQEKTRPETVPVYNLTNAEQRKVPWGHVISMSKQIGYDYPLNMGLWYPDPCITTNKFYHSLNVLLFHWLPAYFIDFLMLILGQKRFMVRIQQKISTGLEVLQFFTLKPWCFKSEKYAALWENLGKQDKLIFNMDMNSNVSEEEYMIRCAKGGRRFLLKETDETLPRARVHLKIMYFVDRICKILIVGGFLYWILSVTGMWNNLTMTPAYQEPLPGWVDNMNGPTGVMIGAGKGVIRSMVCNGELKSEVIPVDIAINGLIVMPYHYAQLEKKPDRIMVFNLTCAESKKKTWKWIMDIGRRFAYEYPFEIGLWYPGGDITTNKLYHWLCAILFMWLPAYFIDFLLLIFGQRRFMIRVQKKIALGLEMLQFFTTRLWNFKSDNFMRAFNGLNEKDQKIFKMDTDDLDDVEYMKTSFLGGRQYVVKEPLSSLPRARTQIKFLYVLDRVCKILICGSLFYWVCLKLGFVSAIKSGLNAVAVENSKSI